MLAFATGFGWIRSLDTRVDEIRERQREFQATIELLIADIARAGPRLDAIDARTQRLETLDDRRSQPAPPPSTPSANKRGSR
jgi:hypothetical protein